jgi:hypothetical protein
MGIKEVSFEENRIMPAGKVHGMEAAGCITAVGT